MSKKYKHIFFDLDHTLWDFHSNSKLVLKQLHQEFHLEEKGITDFDNFFIKYNEYNDRLWARFRNGEIKRDELRWKRIWLTLLDYKIGDVLLAHEISSAYMELLPSQTILMPFAKEVLDHCSQNYEIHMITNGFDATQKLKIQYSGIANYFNHIITSEKSNSMKPHPAIYEYALQTTGATIEDCIMIGDTIDVDIKGAKNAGWDQIFFNPTKLKHQGTPTHEINCLSELKEIL